MSVPTSSPNSARNSRPRPRPARKASLDGRFATDYCHRSFRRAELAKRRDPARDVVGTSEAAPGHGTREPWPGGPRLLSPVSSCSMGARMGSCDQGGGSPIGQGFIPTWVCLCSHDSSRRFGRFIRPPRLRHLGSPWREVMQGDHLRRHRVGFPQEQAVVEVVATPVLLRCWGGRDVASYAAAPIRLGL